jgi:pimeloyl-ACP methyl ester carboxylesterase
MTRLRHGPIELEYAAFGDPQAHALVLIRGLGTQMVEWSPVLIEGFVDAGFRTVIFDNRDAGLSGKASADYSLGDMAADVIGLLDGLGIERAAVFGISLGGMVAQHIAFRYPERVSALFPVMTSSGDPGLPRPAPEIQARLTRTAEGREAVIALNAENRVVFGSPAYPETEAQRFAAAAAAYDRCHFPPGVARQMRAVIADGSRAERLQQVRVPTLVIHGIDDPLIPLAAGEHVAQCIPGARIERIPGMGHNLPDALAPRIVDLVRSFVDEQTASAQR